MNVLTTRKAYETFAVNMIKKSNEILISTYTISDSVILEALKNKKATILLGVPYYISCKDGCKDCKENYAEQLRKIVRIQEKYSNIKWINYSGLHSKYIICPDTNEMIIGGRNVNESNAIDLNFFVYGSEDCMIIKRQFDYVFGNTERHIILNGLINDVMFGIKQPIIINHDKADSVSN